MPVMGVEGEHPLPEPAPVPVSASEGDVDSAGAEPQAAGPAPSAGAGEAVVAVVSPMPESAAVTGVPAPEVPAEGAEDSAAAPSPTPTPVPTGVAVRIDLSKQRAYLLRDGVVEIESPISSGRAGHLTPTGEFAVIEKDIDHRSTLYGSFVGKSSGRTVRRNASSNMAVPAGTRFQGAPMKFFVRFEGATGMHAGNLPGYPASHGCVRMPSAQAEAFFHNVELGTPVSVFGRAPVRSCGEGSGGKSSRASGSSASKAAKPEPTPTPAPKRGWWPFGKRQ